MAADPPKGWDVPRNRRKEHERDCAETGAITVGAGRLPNAIRSRGSRALSKRLIDYLCFLCGDNLHEAQAAFTRPMLRP